MKNAIPQRKRQALGASSSASMRCTFAFGCSLVASVPELSASEASSEPAAAESFLGSHGSFTFMMYAAGGKEISTPSPSLKRPKRERRGMTGGWEV